jgi:hypothetical protein
VLVVAIASKHGAVSWGLSHRLMIFCPHTGVPVDTGPVLNEIGALAPPQVLVDCCECGEDHGWMIEHALLR